MLEENLEIIFAWIGRNDSRAHILFQKGIERNSASKHIDSLPFSLAEEIYKLYGCRNGMSPGSFESFPFLGMDFYSLDNAVQAYFELIKEVESGTIEDFHENLFPIFRLYDDGYFFTLGRSEPDEESPIFCYDFGNWDNLRPVLMYESLGKMIQTLAECCEHNIYSLSFNEYGCELECDEDEFEAIRIRNNPTIQLPNSITPTDIL
ncbi:MAG: hypothetical protein F6J87_14230 [Spirulina sp. SIO3F2]|nr:hypothetical protein [Spirulina sp. SIO3F2]